jgi:4-aminobutyrate aminotransferase
MDWPSGSHASTFGGNPVACAAAIETLRLVEHKYMANAARRGLELKRGLAALAARFACVKEVRGLGLMVGVEVHHEGAPAPALRDRIVDAAFHRGLLLLPCGASTVRFCPPLCLSARQIQTGLTLFDAALSAAVD